MLHTPVFILQYGTIQHKIQSANGLVPLTFEVPDGK